jgi:hypothetical protein
MLRAKGDSELQATTGKKGKSTQGTGRMRFVYADVDRKIRCRHG